MAAAELCNTNNIAVGQLQLNFTPGACDAHVFSFMGIICLTLPGKGGTPGKQDM